VRSEIAVIEQPEEIEIPVREAVLWSRDERIWRRFS
jgi:hypothetical protein